MLIFKTTKSKLKQIWTVNGVNVLAVKDPSVEEAVFWISYFRRNCNFTEWPQNELEHYKAKRYPTYVHLLS